MDVEWKFYPRASLLKWRFMYTAMTMLLLLKVTQFLKFTDMIKADIHIEGGSKVDTYEAYGFIYISADNRLGAPYKEMDKTTYPEQDGENVYPLAVKDAFDYNVRFLVEGASLNSINNKISTFNSALVSNTNMFKKVTFYNYDRKVKIVGYPKPIAEAEDFWYTSLGEKTQSAIVPFTIRVVNPTECDFNFIPTT